MKKVLIHAYADKNIGDDLFLYLLCTRYPNVKFYMFVPKRLKLYYDFLYDNLTAIALHETPLLIQKVDGKFFKGEFTSIFSYHERTKLNDYWSKRVDAQIWLGGSQFVQTPDWKRILAFKRHQQNSGKPFFAISVTVGPFNDEIYLDEVKNVISHYSDICFRDKKSYELIEGSNTRYAADMVFSIREPNIKRQKVRRVCISVINVRKRFGDDIGDRYESLLETLVREYLDRGYEILFMSLCEAQKDYVTANRVVSKFEEDKRIHITMYDGILEDIINTVAESEVMVGTRYHAIVLGLRYGLKVLPIIYEEKTKYLLNDLGYNGIILNEIEGIITRDIKNQYIKLEPFEIKQLVMSAETQFTKIDHYINGFSGEEDHLHNGK
jgi:colanic acid/amylovoran biosynthesis protein